MAGAGVPRARCDCVARTLRIGQAPRSVGADGVLGGGGDFEALTDLELARVVDVVGGQQLVGADAELAGDGGGGVAGFDDVDLVGDRRGGDGGRFGGLDDGDRCGRGLDGHRSHAARAGGPVQADVQKSGQCGHDHDEADDVRTVAHVAAHLRAVCGMPKRLARRRGPPTLGEASRKTTAAAVTPIAWTVALAHA
jgi:hypothetical protein